MTRKQALHIALKVLTDDEAVRKINEILEDMPFTGWSERTIFDTIDQFILDNGRTPTATDFKKKGLPPHPVIKLRFGVTLKEFLLKYYPSPKLCNSRIYFYRTKEEWKTLFICDYIRIKPRSAEEYNNLRDEYLPSWATVAKMFGISKWLDWIKLCGLERHCTVISKPRGKVTLVVSSHTDLDYSP